MRDQDGAAPGRVRRHRDTLQRYFQVHFANSTLDGFCIPSQPNGIMMRAAHSAARQNAGGLRMTSTCHDRRRSATQGIARRNGGRSTGAGALLRRILLASGLLVVLAPAAQATCMRPVRFNMTYEGPWHLYMTVKQGGHCTISLRAGGRVDFERLSVVQAPSHGAVSVAGIARHRYSAAKNYVGNDQFVMRACGHAGSAASCVNLQVDVTIEPKQG